MNKDLFLATLVSFVVIFIYSFFFTPQQPTEEEKTQQLAQKAANTQALNEDKKQQSEQIQEAQKQEIKDQVPQKIITIESANYTAKIDTKNAHISSFKLKKYNFDKPYKEPYYLKVLNLITGSESKKMQFFPGRKVEMVGDYHEDKSEPTRFLLSNTDSKLIYQSEVDTVDVGANGAEVVLRALTSNGVKIKKTYFFSADNYIVKVRVELTNTQNESINIKPVFRLGAGNEDTQKVHNEQPKEGVAIFGNDLETFDDLEDGEQPINSFIWSGVMDFYFVTAIKGKEQWHGVFSPITSNFDGQINFVPNFDLISTQTINLSSGQVWSNDFDLYIGPKEFKEMEKFDHTFIESLDLVFSIVGHPMLFGLRYFHQFVNNWGLAIICLTIAVRLIIFPLALIGMKSMKRMQQLGPKIKNIREQHSKNKDRMNQEIMKLYKRNKINPVGGCLPLLLQIPIFIALYWALLPAIELRQQPFYLWIDNLAAPDHTMILPILMGVTMFFQQKVTPMSATMDPMQRKLFQFFPLMMTLFFITFPSGLVLYWLTSNMLTILQQLVFNKIKIKEVID